MKLIDWQSWWQKRRADAGAVACFALFFVCFFPHVLFGRRYIIAGDALYYSYPLRSTAWQMLKQGAWPIWTTSILSGYPLLSMAQLGLAYPFTWSYLFLRGPWAEQIYVLAPFLLAPIFTYAYLRELRRSRLAAILGALVFGYGGMMASPIANSGLIQHGCMWLPLLLIALERSRRARFVSWLLAATAFYALSVLNGHAQSFVYVGFVAGAYALFLGLTTRSAAGTDTVLSRWRPALVAAAAAVLTMGIAAFQILETRRVVGLSVRNTLTYQLFTQGSFTPSELWQSFTAPLFHVIDMHAYVPPLALMLALIAVYAEAGRSNRRDPRVFFWGGVAIVAIVLMMGEFTPVYRIVYHIPLLNLFRVPSRHTFEWTFAAGVLAAYGWDAIAVALRTQRQTIARNSLSTIYASITLVIAAVALGAVWWLKTPTLQASPNGQLIYTLLKTAFVALTTLALWRASFIPGSCPRHSLLLAAIFVLCFFEPSLLLARWWGPTTFTAEHYSAPSETTRYLQQFSPNEHRIYTRAYLMNEQFEARPRFDSPNIGALYGLQDVAGYEPLMFDRYSRALGGAWLDGVRTLDRGEPDPGLFGARSHVLDILNTSFVVSYPDLMPTRGTPPTPHSDAWQQVYEQRDTVILRNARALPRAWLVAEAETATSDEALARIRGESAREFEPRRTALLEVPQNELPALPGGDVAAGSTAQVVTFEANRIVIETEASTPTVLLVSASFYPGLTALVDGQPTTVRVADYLLRCVALPSGHHRIEMRYTAPAARTGGLISIGTLILLFGLLAYALIFERRKSGLEQPQSELSEGERIDEAPSLIPANLLIERLERLKQWSRRKREVLAGLFFIAVTALMTWPWVTELRNAVSDPGDPYMIAWTLWWDFHQTFHSPLNLFHANIFYPLQYTLAFSEHDYGISLLFFPLFALGFRPLTVHSIASFLGIAFCGYGAFRLLRTLNGSTSAGIVAGVVYGFIPFRFQLLSHLHYMFAAWIPLLLEALVLFARVRSWRRAAWLGTAFLMNGLTSITYLILTLIPLALSAAVLVIRGRHGRERAFWVRGLAALAIASVLLLPFLWPYYKVNRLYGFKWPREAALFYSVHLVDWFSAEPRTKLWNGMGEGLPGVTNHLFPGLLPILLALAAFLLVTRKRTRPAAAPPEEPFPRRLRWLSTIDVLCFVLGIFTILSAGLNYSSMRFFRGGTTDRALMLLMILIVARFAISYPRVLVQSKGRNLIETVRSEWRSDGYWLGLTWAITGFLGSFGLNFFIYRVLYDLWWPLRSLRVPARAAMLCYVGLAVLAGIGASQVAERVADWKPAIQPKLIYLVIIAALMFELHTAPLELVHGAVDPDAVTLRLKQTPMRGGVVELPAIPEQYSNQLYMLRAADHERPLVNAASSFISPMTQKIFDLNANPDIPKDFLDVLEGIPTSYVVFHHGHITPEKEAGFDKFFAGGIEQGRLRLIGRYGDADLYAVVKTEPQAQRDPGA
jgi:Bacterial membrane protein YfhO